MASLVGQQLKDTYDSLLKTSDNDALGGTYKEITDGSGNGSNLYLGTGGNVGIGGSPSTNLEIDGGTSTTVFINSSTHSAGTANEAKLQFGYGHSGSPDAIGYIKLNENSTNSFDGTMTFGVPYNNGSGGSNTRDALVIKNDGNVSITTGNLILDNGAGIDFSDTPNSSGTMTSELLDDYEEGTWTPAWNFATSGSATLSIDSATYTKIGRVVNVNARIFTSSISSPLGKATLTGLPFTANSAIYDVPGSVAELFRWATDIQNLKVIVINNQSYLEMTFNSATDSLATDLSGSDFDSGASKNIMSISVTYFV